MKNSRLAGGLAALAVLVLLLVAAPAFAGDLPAPNPLAATFARQYLGVPYVAGGESKAGVCPEGLTRAVYRRAGIWLSWKLTGQARHGSAITRDQLKPGDLVFNAARTRVGVYTGDGKVVTMPRLSGTVVKYARIDGWGADLAYRRYDANTGYHAALLAKRYLGVPYIWGGASPSGFDASGLTMYVYAQLGASLVHGAQDQQRSSTPIPLSHLQRGDLVFFGNASYSHHVGIYIGKGRMIDAPHTGAVVSISTIQSAWIGGRFLPVK